MVFTLAGEGRTYKVSIQKLLKNGSTLGGILQHLSVATKPQKRKFGDRAIVF